MKRGECAKLNNPSKTFFYAQTVEYVRTEDGEYQIHYHGGREYGATGQTMVVVACVPKGRL